MDIRKIVMDSAKKQGCPEDHLILVWSKIAPMEAPQSEKQIDNDVLYVMHGLGLK